VFANIAKVIETDTLQEFTQSYMIPVFTITATCTSPQRLLFLSYH